MMKHKLLNISVLLLYAINLIQAQGLYDWRGPNRSGVYEETGLLKEWPEGGPELLWVADSNLPAGYSSPSFANDRIYLTGNRNGKDVLIALDMLGNQLWETIYGNAWQNSYDASRSTPTVENKRVYVSSGNGDVACVNGISGEIIWSFDAMKKFNGEFHRWGIAESLLIYENKVFFSPGGKETMMVAMDKMTGEIIWKSKPLDEAPSYTSPILIERNGIKQIISVSNYTVFGISPENGEIIWTFNFGKYSNNQGRNNQTNTPLYHEGKIYVTSGYDHKSVMLDLSDDGKSVSLSWLDSTLDVHHGGVVKVGDYVYGANWTNNQMGKWACLNWNTGEVMYETEWYNKGSIIAAEGMLYCFEEWTGNIALVEATPEEFRIISSFKVPYGRKPFWSHPVIHNAVLYIRSNEGLMAFDIKASN